MTFSGVIPMHEFALPHCRTDRVNGVTVFRILVKEVRDPDAAAAVFRDVSAISKVAVPAFILIDLSRTKHMSGMAFVVLSNLAQQVAVRRGRLVICSLDPILRVGADMMGLGSGLDVYDDEASALASF
jgi:anti-sigma B factor antagonist